MMKRPPLSSRERVKLALAHQETDRIPIVMVCSGINAPARRALERHLKETRGIDVRTYLDSFIGIRKVGPRYVGPCLPTGQDIWGVKRTLVGGGADSYDEIEYYPLARAQNVHDVERYAWPSTAYFDYPSIRDSIAAANADGEHCLMIANGNVFESASYMLLAD